jgi:hypothetical protein
MRVAKTRTGDYSAEFGGFGGAQIDYSLRSGGNRFHGALRHRQRGHSAWGHQVSTACQAPRAFARATAVPLHRPR